MGDDKNFDRFHDVVIGNRGIAEGQALSEHEQVHSAVTPEGPVLEFTCQGCGTPIQMTLEWPEVIALKYGIDPALCWRGQQQVVGNPMPFSYSSKENAWVPLGRCGNGACNWYYGIRIFPHEPERWLQQARRSRFIDTVVENQLSQYATAMANQARGGAAPVPGRR
jgi:hypothetical protein